jgi:hypothetical protein
MTSFEIECPQSFHSCDRLDVFAEHQENHSEFHLIIDGGLLSVIQRHQNGRWQNKEGKPLTVEELAFISQQIENN